MSPAQYVQASSFSKCTGTFSESQIRNPLNWNKLIWWFAVSCCVSKVFLLPECLTNILLCSFTTHLTARPANMTSVHHIPLIFHMINPTSSTNFICISKKHQYLLFKKFSFVFVCLDCPASKLFFPPTVAMAVAAAMLANTIFGTTLAIHALAAIAEKSPMLVFLGRSSANTSRF